MFMLHAVFNKEHLKTIVEDLIENDMPGITILQAYSKGEIGCLEKDFLIKDMNEKIKIEIVVSGEKNKELAMEIIRSECQDLGYGAGKMWITQVLEVERIRTGEKNQNALSINKNIKRTPISTSNQIIDTSIDTPNS